jgi:thiol-disulfide isomerase/thioredoxin
MLPLTRRRALAGAGTVAVAAALGKPRAEGGEEDLLPLSSLKLRDPPTPAPEISFVSEDGAEHHLNEFLGHGMVVNLWATWCVPCVAEMPALAKLARTLSPADIAVLPLSSDRGGVPVVRRFYEDRAITGLPVLLDPKGAAVRAVAVRGIPVTLIIDKEGREQARLEGSADWSTPEAAARVLALVGG